MTQSLRRILIVPYVLLVLALALTIGLSSYRGAIRAVDKNLNIQLIERVGRIGTIVGHNLSLARLELEAAFPPDMSAPVSFEKEIPELRKRFWIAAGLDPENYNNVYYGTRDGKLIGVVRPTRTEASMRLVMGQGLRGRNAPFSGSVAELGAFVDDYPTDVVQQPWFLAAKDHAGDVWTQVYLDERTGELIGTRARRVLDANGQVAGVVATDLSLRVLNEQLLAIRMTSNSLAFIMEPDGTLVASTTSPYLRKEGELGPKLLNANESGNPLIKELAVRARGTLLAQKNIELPVTLVVEGPGGESVFAAFTRVVDDAGLDWIIVAAGPRSELKQDITRELIQVIVITLMAVGLAIAIGFMVFSWVSRDLGRLAQVAHRVGEGDLDTEVGVQRDDEIGMLAKSFEAMVQRLRSDRLTKVANREMLVRRVEGEVTRRQHDENSRSFGLLFIDIDHFKQINDRHGHEIGDKVLIETARRLTIKMRPSDLVARYAGDEFVVFIEDVSDRNILNIMRSRIEETIAEPIDLPGIGSLPCTISVGVAMFPQDGDNVDSLLARADEDMYRRKFASRA